MVVEFACERVSEETVDARKERRKSFAGTGRRGNQRISA
jgi:hypothetical protein